MTVPAGEEAVCLKKADSVDQSLSLVSVMKSFPHIHCGSTRSNKFNRLVQKNCVNSVSDTALLS